MSENPDVSELLRQVEMLTADRDGLAKKLNADRAQLRKLLAKRQGKANVHGGSGEEARGEWCTSKRTATAVGEWDVDPFSNERSHVVSKHRCILARGDNGLVTEFGNVGEYRCEGTFRIARPDTRVFIQPPFELVLPAIEHFGHTRFCALLRFAPDTEWFARLKPLCELICVLRKREEFEPPPGVIAPGKKAGGAPFPHALFYARFEDATEAVFRASALNHRRNRKS